MKMRRLVQCLIGGFIGSSLLFSCSSEESQTDDWHVLKKPENGCMTNRIFR